MTTGSGDRQVQKEQAPSWRPQPTRAAKTGWSAVAAGCRTAGRARRRPSSGHRAWPGRSHRTALPGARHRPPPHGDARREVLHHRKRLDGIGGLAERSPGDEIRLHIGLAFPVVASDADRSFAEAEVGKRYQRHSHASRRRHAQLLENLPIGASMLLQQDADRHDALRRGHRTSPAPARHRRSSPRGWFRTGSRSTRPGAPPDPGADRCAAQAD